MNILICSVGRRVQLIEYFREELHKIGGKVIAVDSSSTAPALYNADAYELVPKINHPEYLDRLKEICSKYEIKGLLSLIDPELELLATWQEAFKDIGVQLISSNLESIEMCFDKYETFRVLTECGIPVLPSYINMDELTQDLTSEKIQFPLIVKPRKGSASLGIHKVNSLGELDHFIPLSEELFIQPFISSEEYGVDCYIDFISNKVTNIFMKKKLVMRAGETDKSISVKDSQLELILSKLFSSIEFRGPIDIDCFRTEEGFLVSEINPRFGGGYPHAHEVGQNFVRNIICNLNGKANEIRLEDYPEGMMMLKYDRLKLIGTEL